MTPEMFFAAEARKPLVWGETECIHTVDRWCVARGKRSFVEASGYDFKSAGEAAEMATLRAMPIWVSRAMRAAGYAKREPMAGDVAIVVAGALCVCAVRGERMWLFRSETGLGAVSIDAPNIRVLAAWGID